LRNPLADPGLFGVAPWLRWARCSLFTGYAVQPFALPAMALAGAAAGMVLLAVIARRAGAVALFTLAGMMLSSWQAR
jgi:iron complex transport system permease protein